MGVLSAEKQADLLKDKGNQYFRKEKLGAAIEAYTEAITLCPSVPLYWTNRALCERKRHQWEKVEADCRRALELDSQCVKAYYLLGLALVHYQQYEEAVKQLEKAMDLGRSAEGNYMVEEIWQELAKARFVEWEAVSEVRQRQQLDLKMHLSQLLREDYDRKLNEAVAQIKAATAAKSSGDTGGIQGPCQMKIDDLIRLDSGSRQGSGSDKSAAKKSVLASDQLFPIGTDSELERLSRLQSEPTSVISKESEVDVEMTQRLSRLQSEPTSVISKESEVDVEMTQRLSRLQSKLPSAVSKESEVDVEITDVDLQKTPFDPLKQHKLSLRRGNSISMQLERSQRFSVSHDDSGKAALPAWRRDPETEAAAAPPPEQIIYPDLARQMQESEERAASTAARAASFLSAAAAERKSNSSFSSTFGDGPQFHSIYDVFKVFKEFMKLQQNEAGQKLLRSSEQYQRRSEVLDDVFDRAAAPDKPGEIPSYLCCKITMGIYRDPVISTSGITYERAALLDHIYNVGPFDPLTRAPLTAAQMVPNLAIKEAVQVYLDQYGWAYGPC